MTPTHFVAISFILFIIFSFKTIKKVINDQIQKRIDKIKENYQKTSKYKSWCQEQLNREKELLKKTEKDAENILKDARENAISLSKKFHKDLENIVRYKHDEKLNTLKAMKSHFNNSIQEKITKHVIKTITKDVLIHFETSKESSLDQSFSLLKK